jgi:hypothetical protein
VGRSTKDADEDLARLVLGATLRARVKRVDQPPLQGHYDLEIRYPDGRVGAGEVVSTRDQAWTKLFAELSGRGYAKCAALTHLWFVTVKPGASLKKMKPHIPALLRELESQGIDKATQSGYGNIAGTFRKHGIQSCSSSQPTMKHPPGFYLLPDILTAWVGDGESVRQFCEDFLSEDLGQSKVDKVGRAEPDERHIVIILTMDQVGHHTAVDTGELPMQAPDLPDEIDWLWVIASKSPPIRAIYWSRAGHWSEALIR